MKFYSVLLFCFCAFSAGAQSSDEQAIREVLSDQQKCWNAGDLDCFMQGYWKSDQLVFIGASGIKYGWETTLENYKNGYPDSEKMGHLQFELISVSRISNDFWSVIGKWSLQRKADAPSGHFTLIFKKIDGEWLIIQDHSS